MSIVSEFCHFFTQTILLPFMVTKYQNVKILINNILCFCKNYPDEPVNKSRWIKEYKEFPYRLEQNLKSVMLDINGEINCFTII